MRLIAFTIVFVLILLMVFAGIFGRGICKGYFAGYIKAEPSYRQAENYLNNGEYINAYKEIDAYLKYCFAKDYVASTGVREAFALPVLQRLVSSSPESREELERTRLELESAIMDGNTNGFSFDLDFLSRRNPSRKPEVDDEIKMVMLFDYLCLLNKALDKNLQSIKVFEKLMDKNPEVAKKGWNKISPLLFKEKRYDVVSHFITDLDKSCRQIIATRSNAIKSNPILQKNPQKSFMIQDIRELLDYGIATGQEDTVRAILLELLKQEDVNPRSFNKYMPLLGNDTEEGEP